MKAKYLKRIGMLTISLIVVLVSMQTCFADNYTITNGTNITSGIANTGNGDTLFLGTGTYNKNGDSNITIDRNITIQGTGSIGSVTIDGQGKHFMFYINQKIDVTFINITFINKFSDISLATIWNDNSSATMTFINCSFTNNTGTPGSMGMNAIVIYTLGNLTVINSTFTDNKAVNLPPIAILNGNLTVINSSFTNNAGKLGGAIYNEGGSNHNTVTIINSNFTNNTATLNGGAIYNDGGNLDITKCIFIENYAGNNADVIYNQYGNTTVSFSIFFNKKYNSHLAFSTNGMIFLNDNFYFWVNPDLNDMTSLINILAYQNTNVNGFYYLNITNNTVTYVGDIFNIKSKLQHNNSVDINNLPDVNIVLLFNTLKINEFNLKTTTNDQIVVNNLYNTVFFTFEDFIIYQLPVDVINSPNRQNNTNNTTTTNNSTGEIPEPNDTIEPPIEPFPIVPFNPNPNDPIDTNGTNDTNGTDQSSNHVIMKKTGIPFIALVLIFLVLISTTFRRKEK